MCMGPAYFSSKKKTYLYLWSTKFQNSFTNGESRTKNNKKQGRRPITVSNQCCLSINLKSLLELSAVATPKEVLSSFKEFSRRSKSYAAKIKVTDEKSDEESCLSSHLAGSDSRAAMLGDAGFLGDSRSHCILTGK